jgi:hypothetical protein
VPYLADYVNAHDEQGELHALFQRLPQEEQGKVRAAIQRVSHALGNEGFPICVLAIALIHNTHKFNVCEASFEEAPVHHQSRNHLSDEELDHTPLPSGQYKGQTPSQVAEHDPEYLVWMAENMQWKVASDLLIRSCKEE